MDEAELGLYRRMLGYNVEKGGGWSQGGACCVAAGGGREERRERWEGGNRAVVVADPRAIVYHIPAQDFR